MLENYRPAWMNEEHDMLADTARRFATEELIPNDARWREQRCVDKAAWLKAGAIGLLLSDIPDSYGGMARSLLLPSVAQQFARCGVGRENTPN